MTEKIKVIIVDDLVTTRESVSKLLQFESQVDLVAEAGTGLEAIEKVREHRPEIVLMDINMPDMDGITASQRITGEFPGTQIIMMSVQSETDYIRRAMVAGARDFLTKPFSLDELLTAIHNAHQRRLEMPDPKAVAVRRPAIDVTAPIGREPEELEGNVIAIYSPKGGVGCTTLAINLAVSLAKKGNSTVLVDGRLQFGDINVAMDLKAKTSVLDLVERTEEMDVDLITSVVTNHKSGLKVLTAPPRPEMAEAIQVHHIETIIDNLRKYYSYVVIDTDSRLDDAILAILDKADKILLVVQPELPGITHTSRFLDLVNQLDFPRNKVKLVVSGVQKKQAITADDVGRALKRPSPFVVPQDSQLAQESNNQGKPIVTGGGSGRPLGKAYSQIASKLMKEFESGVSVDYEEKPRSFLDRLFNRGN